MKIVIPPSYVIFTWYLLFIAGIVPYNPFWWLVIALVVVILTTLEMMYYRNDFRLILMFIVMNVFIKIIPVYHLYSQKVQNIDWKNDLLPGFVLMVVYVAFLTNGTFSLAIIEKFWKKIQYNIQHNKPISPIISYLYRSLNISSNR